jgi:hypothetical protein
MREQDIRIWDYRRAPEHIRQMADPAAAWVAVIPVTLACVAVESLFLRWSTDTHPVARRVLADGSIVLSGAYPAPEVMSSGVEEPRTAQSQARPEVSRSQKA